MTTIETEVSHKTGFRFDTPDVRIAPSLLSADFSRLESDVAAVEKAGAEVLHIDVMDGHFVPNISLGVPVIASLRKRTKLYFDAHLMISEPHRYAESFVKAGCDHITFHIETTNDPEGVVEHIRGLGATAGVCLNPTTPVSAIESIIETVDLVLVMSVWPGFGGQKFIADVLPKVKELRGRLKPHQRLQIDGGIDPQTIGAAAEAGVDLFVAGTAVFRQPDPPKAMLDLLSLARAAGKA
jgi:ribulose-phosphate 3-epimerase